MQRPVGILSILLLAFGTTPAFSGEVASSYRARYALAGFLVRAVGICAKNKKEAEWLLSGLGLIGNEELRSFSRAFPKKINEWMAEGASAMNDMVMSDGIPNACAFARKERERALQLAKEPIEISGTEAVKPQTSSQKEYSVEYIGTCKAKFLNRNAFMPCDSRVSFINYKNHRSSFEFSAENESAIFIFEGGKDRQPDLENYELIVDKVRFGNVKNGQMDGVEGPAEGGCHMRMNKDASNFYEIKCDAFARKRRMVFNFYLTEITKFEKK